MAEFEPKQLKRHLGEPRRLSASEIAIYNDALSGDEEALKAILRMKGVIVVEHLQLGKTIADGGAIGEVREIITE